MKEYMLRVIGGCTYKMITASGCIILAQETNRILLQQRAGGRYSATWGFFGGKGLPEELPSETLYRELIEEMGSLPNIQKVFPINQFLSPDKNFKFYTFVAIVPKEFSPILNKESMGFGWYDINHLPNPMHPGALAQLKNRNLRKKIESII